MKIGLLAYHSACNFGASLQLLSTYMYLKNHQHNPIVINWIPLSLEENYKRHVPLSQFDMQKDIRRMLWQETALCRTTEDVARIIDSESLDAVIIGSDAVAQHHPLLERIVFPCRTGIGIKKNTADMEFPNPFWATWQKLLKRPVPVAVMSVSCQDSSYRFIPFWVRKAMSIHIDNYAYLSVRDDWTRDMMIWLTKGKRQPPITPDPVFAFNQNAGSLVPSHDEIQKKFNLPEKYILLSFLPRRTPSVTQTWIEEFQQIAKADGYTCITLPFAHGDSFGRLDNNVSLPLTPIDWYGLIKYANGYVGNNMHPIVISLHNQVPFFSFDTYGTTHMNGLIASDKSSKIKHILDQANLSAWRISALTRYAHPPKAEDVYSKIITFNKSNASQFTTSCLKRYNDMMDDVMNALQNE